MKLLLILMLVKCLSSTMKNEVNESTEIKEKDPPKDLKFNNKIKSKEKIIKTTFNLSEVTETLKVRNNFERKRNIESENSDSNPNSKFSNSTKFSKIEINSNDSNDYEKQQQNFSDFEIQLNSVSKINQIAENKLHELKLTKSLTSIPKSNSSSSKAFITTTTPSITNIQKLIQKEYKYSSPDSSLLDKIE